MKRVVLALATALVLSSGVLQVHAQVQVVIGTGGGYSYYPYLPFYPSNRYQYILLASEIQNAGGFGGLIMKLALQTNTWYNGTTARATENFTIRMQNTNLTNLSGGWVNTGWTTIYGPATFQATVNTAAGSWVEFPDFTSPFVWDGTSNLLIDICHQNADQNSSGGAYPNLYGFTSSGTNRARWDYDIFGLYGCTNGSICGGTCGDSQTNGFWYTSYCPVTKLWIAAGIESSFPDAVDPRRILVTTNNYDGSSSQYPKPSITFRRMGTNPSQFTYKIRGPLPSQTVVYQGLASANLNDTLIVVNTGSGVVTKTIDFSTGSLGAPTGQTFGNGTLYTAQAIGGEYQLEVQYRVPAVGFNQTWAKRFIIAFDNDIALRQIVAPRLTPYKYLRGVNIPVAVQVQNIGLNNVTNFRVISVIRYQGNIVRGPDTIVYNQTPGLAIGQTYTANFPYFNTLQVGTYTFEAWVELLNASDQNTNNNVTAYVLPSGQTAWTFDVQYDTELETNAILQPTSSSNDVVVNRPYNVGARFRNNGAADQSDVPTTVTIERWNGSSWDLVFQTSKILPDIPATPPATATLLYDAWTPQQTGLHRVCVTISAPGDPVTTNNTLCETFTVQDGLSGTYTIGTANSGSPRNFLTIQDAVDALYRMGVAGPVTFELTDASYVVGSLSGPPGPALDLSSKILGVSATNTVTFKPSLMRSLTRGAVSIRLQSTNGIGIYIAQNLNPSNPNAVLNQQRGFPQLYSNPTPYIRFDGGDQKSLRFLLDVGSATPQQMPHRAVFYLGTGASNIVVRNCLLENWPQSSASYASDLPVVRYIAPNFTFEPDVRQLQTGPSSYSAGVVLRSVVPSQGGVNAFGLDTLSNDNNVVEGCEISGFGYGVVALGVGPLFYNDISSQPNPRYQRYYSKGNVIRRNVIMSVGRAGVYCGYTEGTVIEGNRVLNVGVGSTGVGGRDAAGVMVGGRARPGEQVYNNIGVVVQNNEVSHISSDVQSWGILVEQTQNTFENPGGGTVTFPDVWERTVVRGNIVWSITRTAAAATAAGIHLWTRRSPNVSGVMQMVTPAVANYLTRGDRVVNNTVIMSGDNVSGGGSIVGIGVQNSQAPEVINNAIAVTASGTSVARPSGHTLACLLYQGIKPTGAAGLKSNTNAYWYPNGAVMGRFIEELRDPATGSLVTIDVGNEVDYKRLAQWKAWMRQDLSSVVGNFASDYVQRNTTPPTLRVRTNPLPTGSMLDRRGERLGSGEVDLDGDVRGVSGAKYSIGADEFQGNLYVNDLEALEILSPSVYRSSVGAFSDAEYVMTQAPVNVVVRMRNNGSATQSGVQVQGVVEMEQAPTVWVPVASMTKEVQNLPPGGQVDLTYEFNLSPQTYGDMGQVAPAPYRAMSRNVTPRYRVRFSAPIDENVGNNVVQKEYRFYLMRSSKRMLISTATATADANSATTSANDRVGRLNYDSLAAGFGRLNLPVGAVDVFDRSGWEPRAVNYTMYKQVWWVEDQTKLTRQEQEDLRAFVVAGVATDKRNLVVSSQEIVKSEVYGTGDVLYDNFVKYVLRMDRSPQAWTPRSDGYHNYEVEGVMLNQGVRERVLRTQHALDGAVPMPSLVRVYSDAQTVGSASVAYRYVTVDAGLTDNVMGVATSQIGANVVALGVDWRHYGQLSVNGGMERMIRSVTEYLERNGDEVLGAGFGNVGVVRYGDGTRARLWWETVSERGVTHFVVERRVVGEDGYGVVAPAVEAKGESVERREYGYEDRVERSVSYEYRVGMVSRDGSVAWSRAVVLSGEEEGISVTVRPQPAEAEAVVEIRGGGQYEVEVVDVVGRTVGVSMKAMPGGYWLDVSQLPAGVYMVVVRQGELVVRQPLAVVR